MIHLYTGGARAGKSRLAQAEAEALSPTRLFVATAQPLDDDMAARIARHRADRGPGWETVEEPLALAERLPELSRPAPVLLVDCLTLWMSNLLLADTPDLDARAEALARALQGCDGHVLLVTNEVGLGIVPDNALARRYQDALGRCNQRVAAIADRVTFVVSGLPLRLK